MTQKLMLYFSYIDYRTESPEYAKTASYWENIFARAIFFIIFEVKFLSRFFFLKIFKYSLALCLNICMDCSKIDSRRASRFERKYQARKISHHRNHGQKSSKGSRKDKNCDKK